MSDDESLYGQEYNELKAEVERRGYDLYRLLQLAKGIRQIRLEKIKYSNSQSPQFRISCYKRDKSKKAKKLLFWALWQENKQRTTQNV